MDTRTMMQRTMNQRSTTTSTKSAMRPAAQALRQGLAATG
jgi:hypothetical protein